MVTDISPLYKLKNLTSLNQQKTSVSKEQINRLKKALPNDEVLFISLSRLLEMTA